MAQKRAESSIITVSLNGTRIQQPVVKVQQAARIGHVGQAQGATKTMRDIIDDEQRRDWPASPMRPKVSERRKGIGFVGTPQRCPASFSLRRLASAPTALGTRPAVLLPRAARIARLLLTI